MPLRNKEIAEKFSRLADLLEVEGANEFRVRAYRNAARSIGSSARSIADLAEEGEDLSELPDIGEDLAEKIRTLLDTGELPLLQEVEARTPAALSRLMQIEGLGPKRVKQLYDELDVRSIEDLHRAAKEHRIRALEGFGEKTERAIEQHAADFDEEAQRTLLRDAEEVLRPLLAHLGRLEGIKELTTAGSYRRRKETVGDLDLVVTAKKGTPVMETFIEYEEVSEVVSRGETRATVRLRSGLSVDLRLVPQVSYGAALHYFTGARAHTLAVRRIALDQGYKMNEYGIFDGDKRIAGKSEEEVYASLGLAYIPPELREDRGEIDAARDDKLPALVTTEDLRGDLHCHTHESDGHDDLETLARAASERGYAYLAITDHSQGLTVAHGLDEKRLRRQMEAIDTLNERLEDVVLLKGCEVDILEDGRLDLPDSVLAELDLVVCSVHSRFDLSRDKQTRRVLRAMDNPHMSILGHPTGRLINARAAYDIDLEAVVDGAREQGCLLELNANPERLDLTDAACRMARERGVPVVISTDAHSADSLALIGYGVNQARRGWLRPADVANTRSLKELRGLLKRD